MRRTKTKTFSIGQPMRPIQEILADFAKPIPTELLKSKPVFQKKRKTGEVTYVSWSDYIRLLLQYAPGYSWSIRTQYLGERIVVEGSLNILAQEGAFLFEATGVAYTDDEGYGDPVYDAESSALRRACAKAGLGLHLWEKEEVVTVPDNRGLAEDSTKPNINYLQDKQSTSGTVITEKQAGYLYVVAYKEAKMQEADVKRILAGYGYASAKEIERKNFDQILEVIRCRASGTNGSGGTGGTSGTGGTGGTGGTSGSSGSSGSSGTGGSGGSSGSSGSSGTGGTGGTGEFLSKPERDQIKAIAFANGLFVPEIKLIVEQLGYENSSQIPKTRLGLVLDKFRSTYAHQFWKSPLDAQSWAVAYLQDRGHDMGLSEVTAEYNDLQSNASQTKYETWFDYICSMAELEPIATTV